MQLLRFCFIIVLIISAFTACKNEGKALQDNVKITPMQPDTNFKSQPIPSPDFISTVSYFQPNLFEHNYSATFSKRSLKFNVAETYKYKPKVHYGAQLGQIYVDEKNLTNLPAGAYIRSLMSNLKYVEITELECKTWVETGCVLTFNLKAKVISTNTEISCIVAIDMDNKVTDSCGL